MRDPQDSSSTPEAVSAEAGTLEPAPDTSWAKTESVRYTLHPPVPQEPAPDGSEDDSEGH